MDTLSCVGNPSEITWTPYNPVKITHIAIGVHVTRVHVGLPTQLRCPCNLTGVTHTAHGIVELTE